MTPAQNAAELQFSCKATDDHTVKHANTAFRITHEFAARLPRISALLESDVMPSPDAESRYTSSRYVVLGCTVKLEVVALEPVVAVTLAAELVL